MKPEEVWFTAVWESASWVPLQLLEAICGRPPWKDVQTALEAIRSKEDGSAVRPATRMWRLCPPRGLHPLQTRDQIKVKLPC